MVEGKERRAIERLGRNANHVAVATVWTVREGTIEQATLDPRDLDIPIATAEDLRGGDTQHNADVVRRLLDGEQGAVRDAVVLNAGAALAVYDGHTDDVTAGVAAGITRAEEAIDSGAARAALDRWVRACAEA